jgi:hypothetical protein
MLMTSSSEQRFGLVSGAVVRVGPEMFNPVSRDSGMASESKWSVAVFGVLAGVFLGGTLARWRSREILAGSPAVLDDPRQGTDADKKGAVPSSLEPLSAEVLKERTVEIFPVGYLTLMAIIQGAAFATLFLTIQQERLFADKWSLHTWLGLGQSLATGLTIVIVTHEYLLLTLMARWVPTVFDTLIPYLLGFGEIWMAIATGQRTSWWAALASLCAVAVFAFWHTRTRTMPDAFGQRPALYQRHRRHLKIQIATCSIMMLASIAAALLNSYGICPELLNIGMTSGVTLMGACVLIMGALDQNKLYDAYSVTRWTWSRSWHRSTRSVQKSKGSPNG